MLLLNRFGHRRSGLSVCRTRHKPKEEQQRELLSLVFFSFLLLFLFFFSCQLSFSTVCLRFNYWLLLLLLLSAERKMPASCHENGRSLAIHLPLLTPICPSFCLSLSLFLSAVFQYVLFDCLTFFHYLNDAPLFAPFGIRALSPLAAAAAEQRHQYTQTDRASIFPPQWSHMMVMVVVMIAIQLQVKLFFILLKRFTGRDGERGGGSARQCRQ